MDERSARFRTLFARNTRNVVVWITTGLAIAFTALQLPGIKIGALIVPGASDLIWRLALIAYYWCWRFGCIFDTDIQELAYASLPGKGKWNSRNYGIVALLIVVAVLLCWTRGQVTYFSLTLTAFFFADHIGWRHIVRELDPHARKSAREFRAASEYFALERLRIVRAQIQGNWKWWRMVAGAIIVLMIDLFAFNADFRTLTAQTIQSLRPDVSAQDAASFAYSLLVAAFVVTMEVWHYTIRLKTKISLATLDDLSERYKLERLGRPADDRQT
jgi:hypothetical protein